MLKFKYKKQMASVCGTTSFKSGVLFFAEAESKWNSRIPSSFLLARGGSEAVAHKHILW